MAAHCCLFQSACVLKHTARDEKGAHADLCLLLVLHVLQVHQTGLFQRRHRALRVVGDALELHKPGRLDGLLGLDSLGLWRIAVSKEVRWAGLSCVHGCTHMRRISDIAGPRN